MADQANIKEQPSEPKKTSASILVPTQSGEVDDGLSLGQKLFLIGAVVGVCAFFIRSRGGGGGSDRFKEKNMA